MAEVDGYGITIKFTDGTIFAYDASDGGYSSWHITQKTEEEHPEIHPCEGCGDYDGNGGCKSYGGCGRREDDDKKDKK